MSSKHPTKRKSTASALHSSPATSKSTRRKGKVGSDPRAARAIGGKRDFGAPQSSRRQRDYVSRETKRNDPGASPARIIVDRARTSGVGSNAGGPGSGSGGDLDPDIVGVGFGGSGLSQSAPHRAPGNHLPAPRKSQPLAAPGPKGHSRKTATRQRVRGSTIDRTGGDITTTGDAQDSGSAVNPMARNDDSFASDVTDAEARGADNSPGDNARA